ncbi:hypothetical protein M413DRAFT_447572 [Hebeloma cylindrosporum]|uniref:Uncharacterized protein n=1 Tax=Hebeloma cylindrosporum TaxID=76867 RepID=A0A0C3C5K7_HEBCY|nr:hypothetical protein M413DRAFT_447572 [Hebeloma cylindrosporum h7]
MAVPAPVPIKKKTGIWSGKAATKYDQWRAVAASLGMKDLSENELKTLSKSDPKRFVVHAELALILHLESRGTGQGEPIPHRYIGVSKLCCRPCWVWIEASNEARRETDRWRVRGCHGKYYRGWRYPTAEDHPTFTRFVKAIQQDSRYVAVHELEDTPSPGSDSTTTTVDFGIM